MEFGITFKGVVEAERARYLVRAAEFAGFSYCWFYDSHILWRDCYAAIAMCMEHTKDMRFGPLVTNPDVRDWSVAASIFGSLSKQSGGRFDLAVGRGDSSMRVMGKKPATLARVADFIHKTKAMVRGEEVTYGEIPAPVKFPWAVGHEMPSWIAAYGPLALKTAGEHADGVVLQIADPGLCKWFTDQCIEAGKAAGKDMSGFRSMAAAPAYFGDKKRAIEHVKWFPAMVGNHVADIVEKYGKSDPNIPASLTTYIEGRKGYDYKDHASKDAHHLGFITDDVVESFGIIGSPEQHVEKLKQLEAAGVTQFVIYLMCGEEERIVAEYAEHVLPHFQ